MGVYDELVKESKIHKNELVLNGFTICLLLEGIENDGEDYYWRLVEPNRGLINSSCVMGIGYLKGKIDDGLYKRTHNLFKMNYKRWINQDDNITKLEESIIKLKKRCESEMKEIEAALNE